MNENFFKLPLEKQQRIINSAFKVFSENNYSKAPMSEIADTANISKSLLFHYFTNKKELYLYICRQAKELTDAAMAEHEESKITDLFEMMNKNVQTKCSLMRKFPYVCAFSLRAYYETTPDIKSAVQAIFASSNQERTQNTMKKLDISKLRQDIDARVMYEEIKLACEGYLNHIYRTSEINPQQIEKDFNVLIVHWKKIYELG